jgi:histone H2A
MSKPKARKRNSDSKERKSRSPRAGITFPVGRVGRHLREGHYAKKINKTAPVFLAAVLEYLTVEVLDLAHNIALESKKKKITPNILQSAIHNDTELDEVFKGVTIVEGDKFSNIESFILSDAMKALNLS